MVSGVAIVLDVRVWGSRDPGQRGRPALPHSVLRCWHGARWPLARRRAPHLFHIELGYQLSYLTSHTCSPLMRRRERWVFLRNKKINGHRIVVAWIWSWNIILLLWILLDDDDDVDVQLPVSQSWVKNTTRMSTKSTLFAATAPSSNANSRRSWLTISKLNRGWLMTELLSPNLNSMVPLPLKKQSHDSFYPITPKSNHFPNQIGV
jgi:hypothetical protein